MQVSSLSSTSRIQVRYFSLFHAYRFFLHPHSTACFKGIHRPKIVVCVGAQGGRFRQIVKGEDDIRQDAIMSQVFSYVNKLMDRCDDTMSPTRGSFGVDPMRTRRKLKMITYNILPLNPTSGVSQPLRFGMFTVLFWTSTRQGINLTVPSR